MNRKVSYALCHTNIFVPGVGDLGKSLSAMDSQYKFKDLTMEWTDMGLEVRIRGAEIIVPSTNVQFARYLPEEIKAVKKA